MLINLSLSNIPTEPSNGNPLVEVTKEVVKHAKLTKSMWLFVLGNLIVLIAFFTVFFLPKPLSYIGITPLDVRIAFFIFIGMDVLVFLSYVFAEIFINHKHGRGFK
jgi:ABC-type multidrug transport system fused ATPase/permease subunit